jgi:NADH dehydrogenase [ubiquinone] 1 alpha subcomplex assembly factor 7
MIGTSFCSSRHCLILTTSTTHNEVERRRMISNSSSSNSKKGGDTGKQQAMKRQKERTMPASSGTPSTQSTSSDETSKSYRASPPRPSSTGGFQLKLSEQPQPSFLETDRGGLARLNIQPKLKQYYFDDDDNASNPSVLLPPTWESDKRMSIPGIGSNNPSALRSQSQSSLALDKEDMLLEIDRESLFDPKIHLPHAPQDWKGYEAATPLSDFLMQRIGVSGQPITTAEYMRHALTHPKYGYYTSSSSSMDRGASSSEDDWDSDEYSEDSSNSKVPQQSPSHKAQTSIFGPGGDFVTAPELSSVFGHCLCVWFMTQWQALFRPTKIQLVELGPGKGTLMADILELAHSSKLLDFGRSITSIHLIEASIPLRKEQQATLTKVLGHLVDLEFFDGEKAYNDGDDKQGATATSNNRSGHSSGRRNSVNTIRVEWHRDFAAFQKSRDKDVPTMVILQEFLDALPVHQFQQTEEGWRERMIDVVAAEDEKANREAIEKVARFQEGADSSKERPLIPRLRQVLAPQVTPAVELLLSSNNQYDHYPEGTVVEICPDALLLVQDIVKVLEESKGAALIIDYGEEGTTDTLRAFSRHRQVPLTSRPGQVDVTADVDFFALKNCVVSSTVVDAASASYGDPGSKISSTSEIHPFGPVPQGEFLMKMGAGELTMNAIEKTETTEEQAQAMADALKYLVMPEHMGTKFKVLALARKRDGLFSPPGME